MGRRKSEGAADQASPRKAALSAADAAAAASFSRLNRAVKLVSTGHPYIDYVLGAEFDPARGSKPGGILLGRHYEVYGPESNGKSIFTLLCSVEVCKNKHGGTGNVTLVDAERCFSPPFFEQFCAPGEFEQIDDNKWRVYNGVLTVVEPASGEQGIEEIAKAAHARNTDLAVVDSVAALVPENETVEKIVDGEDTHRLGEHASLLSRGLRSLTPACSDADMAVIWVNQIRMAGIGGGSRPYQDTTGGRALKFYCSVRLEVRREEEVKIDRLNPFTGEDVKETVAIRSKITCVKNKTAIPHRFATVTFSLHHGYNLGYDVLTPAVKLGWIQMSGSWFSLGEYEAVAGVAKVQGIDQLRELVSSKPELRDALVDRVLSMTRQELPKP